MGQPAAKQGDTITAIDMHLIQPPGPSSPVLVPHPYNGTIVSNVSKDVMIEGKPAATVGSTANNTQPHMPQGGSFITPPTNSGTVTIGSATVLINGKPAARAGDSAQTCADPVPNPNGKIVATSTVLVG